MRALTPSTPFTYRPVVPGIFASFRVLKSGVFPAQGISGVGSIPGSSKKHADRLTDLLGEAL
jgi:hypothetical protein